MDPTDPNPERTADHIAWQQRRFKTAVNRFNREIGDQPAGLLGHLFAWHWLRAEVHPHYQRSVLTVSRNPEHVYLTVLLLNSATPGRFIRDFLNHWRRSKKKDPRKEAVRTLLKAHRNSIETAARRIENQWRSFNRFQTPRQEGVRTIQGQQKKIALDVGGEADQARLALIDQLPEPEGGEKKPFAKLGFIPHLACPQSCRHCQFVWRPALKKNRDPTPLLKTINGLTDGLLFTGGDLTGEMELFHDAIARLDGITTFAILLNGSFASGPGETEIFFRGLRTALKNRPATFPKAEIVLQISFDEYHQEILADRHGRLKERIPVAHIAHIVLAAPRFPEIRLVLLHKQNRLNFSQDLFRYGVFARLARTLAQQGQRVRVLAMAPSPRAKADPGDPSRFGTVIRDAHFELNGHPGHRIHLMSSTIDAYGRAALLDGSEYVDERAYLQTVLKNGAAPGDGFDTDLMFWRDGTVTCFSAIHIWLGNYFTDGDTILSRHRKDPLLRALERFDRRLLDYYGEVAEDLEELSKKSTGPHHLFHELTKSGRMRLHLTQRLLFSQG